MVNELRKGEALVLTGPRACGKSTLARQIASRYGSFEEIRAEDLEHPFSRGKILAKRPAVLVVEGRPTLKGMGVCKRMLEEGVTAADRKGEPPVQVEAPYLIFCTDPLPPGWGGRRFRVVNMGKEKSDGSTADYYQLPEGATELQDIISAQNMNAQMGEIGRAWKRYGLCPHSERLRDLRKIIFYAQAEIDRIEKYEGVPTPNLTATEVLGRRAAANAAAWERVKYPAVPVPECFGEWFTRGGLATKTCPHARMCTHKARCEAEAKEARDGKR